MHVLQYNHVLFVFQILPSVGSRRNTSCQGTTRNASCNSKNDDRPDTRLAPSHEQTSNITTVELAYFPVLSSMVLSCDLVFQLGPKKVVPLWLVEEKWRDIALPREQFDDIVRIGNFTGDVEWLKFFALGCSTISEVSASWTPANL